MTVLRVSDWASQVRWYTETLGLELVLRDDRNEFAFLAAGAGRLGLQGGRRGVAARSKARLVFQVPDLDRQRERLVAAGVDVSEPIENHEESYREARLHDPEGNSLTLFTWTAGRSHAARPGPDDSQTGD